MVDFVDDFGGGSVLTSMVPYLVLFFVVSVPPYMEKSHALLPSHRHDVEPLHPFGKA
ncbi:MAG TPA: hypothetical protein VEI57_09045 [Nitrospirota bacterium]|nr:hypothetical protein [Nitrospirota bacterium]